MDTLQEFQQKESFHFGELQRAWDDQNLDPDDVFFHVQERRRQIKEQIRELQKDSNARNPGARSAASPRASSGAAASQLKARYHGWYPHLRSEIRLYSFSDHGDHPITRDHPIVQS